MYNAGMVDWIEQDCDEAGPWSKRLNEQLARALICGSSWPNISGQASEALSKTLHNHQSSICWERIIPSLTRIGATCLRLSIDQHT